MKQSKTFFQETNHRSQEASFEDLRGQRSNMYFIGLRIKILPGSVFPDTLQLFEKTFPLPYLPFI